MKYKQLLVNASMVIASLAAPVANATPTGTATYDRVTVVEEGTGTWCGWCVRGIVALEYMRENYPDKFIGIGVHYGDVMENSVYINKTGISGFPGCNINRTDMGSDVNQSVFVNAVATYSSKKAYGKVSVTKAELNPATFTVTASAEAEFCYTGSDSYKIAFVLLQDNVGPYAQNNYYSGGGNGTMGGFESLPNPTNVVFNDVARAIFPAYEGEVVAKSVVAGQKYVLNGSTELSSRVTSNEGMRMVALLIDASGKIINAGQAPVEVLEVEGDLPDAGNYRYVDLGLSVLWAKGNILNADNYYMEADDAPETYGILVNWTDFSGSNKNTNDNNYPSAEPPTDICGNVEYDLAAAKWGYSWRLPSQAEFQELVDNCETTEETLNSVKGMRFTSKINGNSIFLPYAGYRSGIATKEKKSAGYYWSGTLNPEPVSGVYQAYSLKIGAAGADASYSNKRSNACSIRPVCSKESGGVEEVFADESAEVISTTYYNLSGMQISEPQSGLVIKKSILSNGKVKAEKLIIRK